MVAPKKPQRRRPSQGGALSAKHERFVAEFLIDLNATAAYKRAGFGARGRAAITAAARLLRRPDVAAAIAAGKRSQLANAELSAARVLEELRRIAFADIRGFYTEGGRLKELFELTAEQAACIAGLEVVIENVSAGDGKQDVVKKLKLTDKVKALDLLCRHFGLLNDKLQLTSDDANIAALQAGRARVAAARAKRARG